MTAYFFHRIPRGWAPHPASCSVTPAEARGLKAAHRARVAKAGSVFRAYKIGEQSLWRVTGTLTELFEAFGDEALPLVHHPTGYASLQGLALTDEASR